MFSKIVKKSFTNLTSLMNRCMTTKTPLKRQEPKELPIFEYGTSKSSYRRVFVVGNIQTGALGVPYLKKRTESPEKLECLKYPKRLTFAEKHTVTAIASGFGFTAFAVDSDTEVKLYGTGLNTDSQIGYHAVREGHPLEILFFPQPISLPIKNPTKTKIVQLAAGRAHLAVLTDKEGLFLMGNNSYGQCGREIVENEDYAHSNYVNHIPSLNSERITSVECGQDHTFALTESGAVFSCGWGADGQTGLETFTSTASFTPVGGDLQAERIVKISSRSDFVLALSSKGDVFGWGNAEYGQIQASGDQQQVARPTHLPHLPKMRDVAAGGAFCIVLSEAGDVFAWGYGILGAGPRVQQASMPVLIPRTLFGCNDFHPDSRVVKVVCGLSHSMAITNFGDVFAWGRNTRCCLGLGDEKDQFFPLKVALGGVAQDVACGADHTVVICKPFV